MKTEKIGTVIETVNGGITDAAGVFIYSNQGWDEKVPAFIIDNSTATLAGINERNFNRRPVSLWFRETQGLALVRRLVTSLGGTVHAAVADGEFRVRIRLLPPMESPFT